MQTSLDPFQISIAIFGYLYASVVVVVVVVMICLTSDIPRDRSRVQGVTFCRFSSISNHINDLKKDLRCQVKFFADDTSLFSIVDDTNKTASELNDDLKSIFDLAY